MVPALALSRERRRFPVKSGGEADGTVNRKQEVGINERRKNYQAIRLRALEASHCLLVLP